MYLFLLDWELRKDIKTTVYTILDMLFIKLRKNPEIFSSFMKWMRNIYLFWAENNFKELDINLFIIFMLYFFENWWLYKNKIIQLLKENNKKELFDFFDSESLKKIFNNIFINLSINFKENDVNKYKNCFSKLVENIFAKE